MTTFEWSVANMLRDPVTGGVKEIEWRCRATQSGFIQEAHGKVELDVDPTAPDFVPYEEITHDMALGWARARIIEVHQGHTPPVTPEVIEQHLQNQLNTQINPPLIPGRPWEPQLARWVTN